MKIDHDLINISNARILGEYGCGAYGANAYGSACTTSTSAATDGGLLADTGYNILLPLALGASLIIGAVILIVKQVVRRRRAASRP